MEERRTEMLDELTYIQQELSSVWPDWTITKKIGKGSFGTVYEITRNDLGRTYSCALKVLHMETGDNGLNYDSESGAAGMDDSDLTEGQFDTYGGEPDSDSESAGFSAFSFGMQESALDEFISGVIREIDMMMRLKGTPNIVSIEDYKVLRSNDSCTILIRMELLESLDKYYRRTGKPGWRDVVRLGTDICTALEFCEKYNIIHRDIKPGNIFYSEKAGFKLGDFGISRTMATIYEKVSMSGAGTFQYMAPEIYDGSRYDNTVDLYSLGIVLYILLNKGLPPFCDSSDGSEEEGGGGFPGFSALHEANIRRLKRTPLQFPCEAGDELSAVICKACDPYSENRYQTAAEFKEALQGCLTGRKASGAEQGALSVSDPAGIGNISESGESSRHGLGSAGGGSSSSGENKDSSDNRKIKDSIDDRDNRDNRDSRDNEDKRKSGRKGKPPGLILLLAAGFIALAGIGCFFLVRSSSGSPSSTMETADSTGDSRGSVDYADTAGSAESDGAVYYTIISRDNNGVTLEREVKEGLAGEKVTEIPKEREGYRIEADPQTLVLSEDGSDNIILFQYTKVENSGAAAVSYTVICVDEETSEILSEKIYYGEKGASVLLTAPKVEGFVPRVDSQTIVLSNDEEGNVFYLSYDSCEVIAGQLDIPDGNVLRYKGHTYYALRTESIDSFRDANQYCREHGGHLAVLSDAEENAAVYDYVFYDLKYESAYFGLTDDGSEGSWYWVDGTPFNFESWLEGQPDGLGDTENYALFWYTDVPYKWNDGDFGKDAEGRVTFLIEWDQ